MKAYLKKDNISGLEYHEIVKIKSIKHGQDKAFAKVKLYDELTRKYKKTLRPISIDWKNGMPIITIERYGDSNGV